VHRVISTAGRAAGWALVAEVVDSLSIDADDHEDREWRYTPWRDWDHLAGA